jgi:hypothetical protein
MWRRIAPGRKAVQGKSQRAARSQKRRMGTCP